MKAMDEEWMLLFLFIKNFLFKNLNSFKFIMIEFAWKSGRQSFWINTCNNSFTKKFLQKLLYNLFLLSALSVMRIATKFIRNYKIYSLFAGIPKRIKKMLKYFNWLYFTADVSTQKCVQCFWLFIFCHKTFVSAFHLYEVDDLCRKHI